MTSSIRPYRTMLPSLGKRCYIDPAAVVIGKVELADDVSVWPLTVIRGDVNHIRIGARSNIQDGSVIHVSRPSPEKTDGYPTTIGDDVTIAHKVMLHGCTIGSRVMVGMGAIVLDGATIEDEVIVGAGALVAPGKTLASGYLYTGSPAKPARPLREGELDHVLENGANYVALKDDYLQAQ